MISSKILFEEERERELYLEDLTVNELLALLPVYNENVDLFIRQLLIKKGYEFK